jgi:hypothetical protein
MSGHHVHYDFLIGGASFIICGPSTIYELELPIADKLADFVLHGIFLEVPPPLKVVHLGLRESAALILLKCLHHAGNDV